jgi:hypothetical protein
MEATLALLRSNEFGGRWAGVQTIRTRPQFFEPPDLENHSHLKDVLLRCEFAAAPTQLKKSLLGSKTVWQCLRCKSEATGESCACGASPRGFRDQELTPEKAALIIDSRMAVMSAAFSAASSSAQMT